jgi:hypothetical protein
VIVASHDSGLAELADRVLAMEDGRLREVARDGMTRCRRAEVRPVGERRPKRYTSADFEIVLEAHTGQLLYCGGRSEGFGSRLQVAETAVRAA